MSLPPTRIEAPTLVLSELSKLKFKFFNVILSPVNLKTEFFKFESSPLIETSSQSISN